MGVNESFELWIKKEGGSEQEIRSAIGELINDFVGGIKEAYCAGWTAAQKEGGRDPASTNSGMVATPKPPKAKDHIRFIRNMEVNRHCI